MTRARFPEGAKVHVVAEDDRPAVDLDPDEEAGMLEGLQEADQGRGMPITRLRAKLRRIR